MIWCSRNDIILESGNIKGDRRQEAKATTSIGTKMEDIFLDMVKFTRNMLPCQTNINLVRQDITMFTVLNNQTNFFIANDIYYTSFFLLKLY